MFAVKRALKLNNKEATLMAQHAGFRRVVYNAGLRARQGLYGTGIKVSDSNAITTFKKVLTNFTKKAPGNEWMNKMSSRVYQNALKDLADAFGRYRQGLAGHPVFAKKKDGQSFTVDASNGKVLVSSGVKIKIPTLGTFRLHEPLTESYVSQTFHVSKEGDRWFVSFCVDVERLPVNQLHDCVGVDVGIKSFATLSNGQSFDAPKPLKQAKTKLARLQRKASKQIKGSKNQRKTYRKVSKLHARVANIRKDFLHKTTTHIAKTFKVIKIEDLNVKGMMANHKLAGAIADVGFYEFRRQIEYKCLMYGAKLELVNQWFPSSKTCSCCGSLKDMPLKERTYECAKCGLIKDRDLNAAINILNYQPQALRG
jgi:putative transposase